MPHATLAERAASEYYSTLLDSKLTLCPSGKNPEQYRIWEAIMAGSIPVVEDPSGEMVPGTFVHPSYGTGFRCQVQDIHRLLKETAAPVLFVRDWATDLPALLEQFGTDEALQARADALAAWYARFLTMLRSTLECQIRRHMQ